MKKKLLNVALGAMLAAGAARAASRDEFMPRGEPLGEAYSEGVDAFYAGAELGANPYANGTPEAVGWDRGWTYAQG